ncbi:MAG: hypothetical protein ACK5NT_02355 [Pyrinomonadaceae bacterium]
MFCPKCGFNNESEGRFCRKCGNDLQSVGIALVSNSETLPSDVEKRITRLRNKTISSLVIALGFFAVLIALAVSKSTSSDANNWVWFLFPAFALLGASIKSFFELRSLKNNNSENQQALPNTQPHSLNERRTEFVNVDDVTSYQTGDLVPASVVENTTRLLDSDAEAKTKTRTTETTDSINGETLEREQR